MPCAPLPQLVVPGARCHTRRRFSEWAGLTSSPRDAPHAAYFIVGMMNSAPLRMPVGQRDVMVLMWV